MFTTDALVLYEVYTLIGLKDPEVALRRKIKNYRFGN